jgi:hypothetical protein
MKTIILLLAISTGFAGAQGLPADIERLVQQRETAQKKIDETFTAELKKLRGRYVSSGEKQMVETIDKILEGGDPRRVADPIVGMWIYTFEKNNDTRKYEFFPDGRASIGLVDGQHPGRWVRNGTRITIYKGSGDEVFGYALNDGTKLSYKGNETQMTGVKVPSK